MPGPGTAIVTTGTNRPNRTTWSPIAGMSPMQIAESIGLGPEVRQASAATAGGTNYGLSLIHI